MWPVIPMRQSRSQLAQNKIPKSLSCFALQNVTLCESLASRQRFANGIKMLGFLKFFLIGFVGLTVLYVLLTIYVRSLTRERLEKDWEDEGSIGVRDDYVQKGLDDYAHSIRPKLLLGVYILPLITFCVIFYMTNFM